MFTSLTEKLTYFNSIYNHYENQDSRKVYTTTGPAAGGVWRLNPPPKVLLAYLPQDGQSLRSCKGILKDASNVHVISKPTRTIYYSAEQLLHQYLPTYYQTQSSINCRLGRWQSNNDNINLRKSFLARDYALNRSSTPDSTASHVFKRQFHALLSISN